MGTFADYTGNMKIKNKKKFTQKMSKILYYGGMMTFDTVKMFDREIALLKPVEIKDEKVYFHYNYFEDDSWETAGYNPESGCLFSGKIGSREFNNVMTAAYMLYEQYDKEPGIVKVNGEVISHLCFVGWLNHIFGTRFAMENRFQIWETVEKDMFYKLENWGDTEANPVEIMSYLPFASCYAAGSTELTDLLYIAEGTDSLKENTVKEGTYPADVLKCKKALMNYLGLADENGETELLEFLKMKRENRADVSDTALKHLADISLYMPARVILYLTAELKEKEFWTFWKELKDNVYHDEEMKVYASEELTAWREAERKKPIAPVTTSEFLIQDGGLVFFNTPEELEDEPKYYISDADRLYWWDGSDKVVISEETDEWLKGLAKQHREIKEHIEVKEDANAFLKKFIELIDDLCNYYARIYPFQNMFYEFLQNSQKEEYVAALELLKIMADDVENRKIGGCMKYARSGGWDITNRKITHNRARIKIKRYLSVLANKKLREKYFGF